MTVKRLLRSIDSYELSEWMAYYELEPFGPAQEDLRSGYLCSLLYNPKRKKGTKTLKPQDFFPSIKAEDAEQNPEVWSLYLQALTVSLGGEIKRKNG